ncbi:TnsA endonuclease C-terminal domain-containing protein [Brevibacillus sp. SYSU BS000544]|uniref:TnsA endonuclease C-terminal domain-containing protein n=1 Tax=Brevibacillus sp. SYSU BS000544 TaxID=3416443 RepID=UPI003CE5C32C
MSKRQTGWTEEKIVRYLKEGRGQGEGNKYKPWLTIQDVPSKGRVTRTPGWKTDRIHHFMSDLERKYFFLMEWTDDVVDIREQFPLDREATVSIADKRQIKHPIDQQTQTPIVFTTDFLLTTKINGKLEYLAIAIKPYSELDKIRTIEKLEIEKTYWTDNEIDFQIVTDKDIPSQIVSNIEWIYSSYWLDGYEDIANSELNELLTYLQIRLQKETGSLQSLVEELDREYAVESGTFLSLVKHLIARKVIVVDIHSKLTTRMPVSDIKLTTDRFTKKGLRSS